MKPEGMFLLPLTVSQRIALIDLVIEHMTTPGTSEEFTDFARNETTRATDFLRLLDQARYFPEIRVDLAKPEEAKSPSR